MGKQYYLVTYRCDHYIAGGESYDTYHNDVTEGNWVDFFRKLHDINHEPNPDLKQKYVFLNALEITEEEFKEFEGQF